MTNLQRVQEKIFASNAPASEVGQFGSAVTGTKVETTDIATIQALGAYTEGWGAAVVSDRNYPTLQEMNGVLKVLSYQTAYAMQKGVPEWNSGTTYYIGDICKGVGNGNLYISKVNENIGNAVTDSTYWTFLDITNSSNSLVVTGTVIASANSATPTGYLYCNGAAVSRTTYAKLFSAIGTTYGAGDGTTTFNLPNYSSYKFVTSGTVSIKGNGKALGLTNGTEKFGIANSPSDYVRCNTSGYGANVGASITKTNISEQKAWGVTTDATKSGITGTVTTATIKWYIKY